MTRRPLYNMLLPHQQAFVDDEHEFVCALVASRGGKTTAALCKADEVASKTPFGDIVYIALTKKQAGDIVWPQLRKYDAQFNMGLKFNETLKEVTWPTQTKFRLFGGDRPAELDRLRGQAFDCVIIDEGKSYSPATLAELIREVLEPRIHDRFGQMYVIGTPGHIMAGPFYEMTTSMSSPVKDWGFTKGWSQHYWNLKDNTAMKHLWERALRRKAEMEWKDNHPVWMREYLGKWAPAAELKVLKYNKIRHSYTELPQGTFKYLLSCKFAPDGTFALCVLAYSQNDPHLYLIEDFRDYDVSLTEAAKLIKSLEDKYGNFVSRVAVASEFNKTLINTFNMRFRFGFMEAPAEDTKSLIELVNNDFRNDTLKFPRNSYAAKEMELLHWEDNKKEKFGEALPSDVTECFLHVWKNACHHLAKPVLPGIPEGTPEWWAAWEEANFQKACEENRNNLKQKQRSPWFQRKRGRTWLRN